MLEPKTQYAKSGDVYIAYQVSGNGPIDLVLIPGFVTHLEFHWEEPMLSHLFRRLASFSRLIRFDKRGAGLSDRVNSGTIEDRMDDVIAVMNAVGSERAAFIGVSEGGPLSISLAATHLKRTLALVLWNTFPRYRYAPDYPHGFTPDVIDKFPRLIKTQWGTGAVISCFAAPAAEDKRFLKWWGECERLSMSPGGALLGFNWFANIDVRKILPVINVPTLVIHSAVDSLVPPAHSQYMAGHIKGAKYVEVPGEDHFSLASWDMVVDEIEEFLTGNRPVPEVNRVLATVLFTDIVGSTELANRIGDREWRALLEYHNSLVRKELLRFQGNEIENSGDGFYATFNGPTRAVYCACSIRDNARKLGLKMRAGLHTGEVEQVGSNVGGIAVHIGAHVSAIAQEDEVLVSSTIKDLVIGSKLRFSDRGDQLIKGVPEKWKLFAVDV